MFLLTVLAVAILSATGVTQNINISDLPTCAQGCLINATSEQTACAGADVGCLCKNYDFINVVACCISSSCNATEQTKAISANVKLCASANVSIPNYLGCSPSLASKFSASAATASQSIPTSQSYGVSSYNGPIQSAVTPPTSGAVATFTGRAIFTGSCTTPEYAMLTQAGGGVLEYPWVGCSNDRLACCPFDINVGGLLSVCPRDYTTTSSACCPSGWAIHTSTIGNQVPCVSMLRTPLAAPSVTGLRKRAPISVVVTTQLYTLKYSLKPQKSGLSAGAKAGIGVGVTVVAIFGALLVSLIIHKRKLRSQSIREGTIIGDGNWYGPPRSDTFSNVGGHLSHPGDLPSPTSMRQMPMGGGFWMPPTAPQRPPTPPPAPVPMQELPASTHIHEHHPAFQSSEHDSEHEPEPHPVLATHHNNEPSNSGGLVSSTEESDRK